MGKVKNYALYAIAALTFIGGKALMKEQGHKHIVESLKNEKAKHNNSEEIDNVESELYDESYEIPDFQNLSDYPSPEIEESSKNTQHDPFAWLSQRSVRDLDTRDLSKSDLRILRNAIFARHGYIFRDKHLLRYFSQFQWYKPLFSDVSDRLNATEKNNIRILKSWE